MSTLNNRISELEVRFSQFTDWEDKYKYLIKLGKDLEQMDTNDKVENNLVKGCVSKVWLSASLDHITIKFSADSDATITKGIIALLITLFNGCKPAEILSNDFGFIDSIGLRQHLSLNRANGLASMLKQIKFYAMAFQAKLNL